jgi:transcription-repair coupling factor (superfamily II helicase)
VKIAQDSRLVGSAELAKVRQGWSGQLCRRANVAEIEGRAERGGGFVPRRSVRQPRGADRVYPQAGARGPGRPDMKVVFFADWEEPEDRLKGAARILRALVAIAERAKAA